MHIPFFCRLFQVLVGRCDKQDIYFLGLGISYLANLLFLQGTEYLCLNIGRHLVDLIQMHSSSIAFLKNTRVVFIRFIVGTLHITK